MIFQDGRQMRSMIPGESKLDEWVAVNESDHTRTDTIIYMLYLHVAGADDFPLEVLQQHRGTRHTFVSTFSLLLHFQTGEHSTPL